MNLIEKMRLEKCMSCKRNRGGYCEFYKESIRDIAIERLSIHKCYQTRSIK